MHSTLACHSHTMTTISRKYLLCLQDQLLQRLQLEHMSRMVHHCQDNIKSSNLEKIAFIQCSTSSEEGHYN
jgi:hypothetical protein